MTNKEPKEPKESKYNKELFNIADNYIALQKQNILKELSTLKEGAKSLASRSNIPELQEICRVINKIKF